MSDGHHSVPGSSSTYKACGASTGVHHMPSYGLGTLIMNQIMHKTKLCEFFCDEHCYSTGANNRNNQLVQLKLKGESSKSFWKGKAPRGPENTLRKLQNLVKASRGNGLRLVYDSAFILT
eukprot:IDg2310t1